MLFELNIEYSSQKLIVIIYSLYASKKVIKILLEKCVNLIKGKNILKYPIKDLIYIHFLLCKKNFN